ncbi:right-handed parallel beta-helix repeat-containing protein [Streptomyces sp. NPDC090083]|uniref:right-handed parallel beta-helix repeat-containing protein n=1 Tax=Streptomyces sp. NPDC090083 TaxID=3365941 RepID=UPI003826CE5D
MNSAISEGQVAATPAAATATVVSVSTASQLSSALAAAKPGDTIQLADGTYTGKFAATTPGTASQPITLTGSNKAVIHSSEYTGPGDSVTARTKTDSAASPTSAAACPTGGVGYGLWLNGAPYWNLTGFTIDTASKGIVLDSSPHVTVNNVEVRNIGDEGVHFRKGSSAGVIKNSYIHDTGQNQPGYGEGVYIGSAKSNWACYAGPTGVDASDNVQVLNNRIGPNVAAEGLDIKEGTKSGIVTGNTFNGIGSQNENSADSAIDVKGDAYRINSNTVASPYLDGFQTHTAQKPYGCGNTFAGNTFTVTSSEGYGIDVTNNGSSKCGTSPNIVYVSNRSTGGAGLTNIPVTAGG